MKHGLMELYWHFYKESSESDELTEVGKDLAAQLSKEQKKLLLKMIDLNAKHLDDETFAAFEAGFKLASCLACELVQPPHLFLTEEHLALEDV